MDFGCAAKTSASGDQRMTAYWPRRDAARGSIVGGGTYYEILSLVAESGKNTIPEAS
jgi:hypothetical protein